MQLQPATSQSIHSRHSHIDIGVIYRREGLPSGYCATDMSSHRGSRSAYDGADTAVWLALLPAAATQTGRFFFDREDISPGF